MAGGDQPERKQKTHDCSEVVADRKVVLEVLLERRAAEAPAEVVLSVDEDVPREQLPDALRFMHTGRPTCVASAGRG